MTVRFAPDRLNAAVRLERARQIIREHGLYRIPVTRSHLDALTQATRDYDLATALLRPTGRRPVG